MSWTSTTLGECAELRSGGTPSKSVASNWVGEVPWVSAKDFGPFRLFDSEDHISEAAVRAGARLAPQGSTLILVRGMTLHGHVPMTHCGREVSFNQDIKALLPKSGVAPLYLTYALLAQKDTLQGLVDSASHGTGRIKTELLKRLPVKLPSLPEQERITAVLGSLDDKIELNRKMNRTFEEVAQTLFRAWFVDFEGETEFVDSELGPAPRGWKVATISELVNTMGGGTPSTKEPLYWEGGEVHWTTPRDLSSVEVPILLDTARKITEKGLSKISSGLLPIGTVLLSSRAPVGYTAIAQIPLAVNQGYIAIPPGGELSSYYVLFWLQNNMDRIKSRAGGTTFKEISKRSFRPMLVLKPPSLLLKEFDEVVGPLFERITINERQSRTLAELRDTLLPKLISGQIRIPEAAKLAEDAGASLP